MMELPMHKSLKLIGLAGAASALALTPALASAQDEAMNGTTPPSMPDTGTDTTTPPTTPPTAPSDTTTETPVDPTDTAAPPAQTDAPPEAMAGKVMTPEQQQAAIAKWPADTQTYYQSLSEDRQKMFWALSDNDKVTLSQMPEEQRESVWAQIESRVKPLKN
jgi:hypothetical protein